MNVQDMRRLLETEPFLGYMGLHVIEAQAGMVVLRLEPREEVMNHAGTIHGGAQFTLGEATAVALVATVFPERLADLTLLTAQAAITYHRAAHGTLTARAQLPFEACEGLRTELGIHGRVRVPVNVVVVDTDGRDATTLVVECAVHSRR